jgi:hypothetical protein
MDLPNCSLGVRLLPGAFKTPIETVKKTAAQEIITAFEIIAVFILTLLVLFAPPKKIEPRFFH